MSLRRLGLSALLLGVMPLLLATAPLVDDTLDELEEKLQDLEDKSDFFGYRSRAVRDLARIGTPEAWELVVGALLDIAPKCADEAQLRLGELEDPEVLEDLFGKLGLGSRDRWVRLRVAESFGRMSLSMDATDLARSLREKDAEVRRSLMWSIERLAQAGRIAGDPDHKLVPALVKAARRDKDGAVSGAALYALFAMGLEGARASIESALEDEREQVRCAAVALRARDEDPMPVLQLVSADESVRVRTACARALARLESAPAARLLVQRLTVETELRLRWRIIASLRGLSGLKHGADVRPWQVWAAALPDDWAPAGQGGEAEVGEEDLGDRSASFAGLPVLSEHVCFLVDMSGSLWKKNESGQTPKQVVEERLREALEALPEQTEFNIIPYTSVPHPWQEELERARKRTVGEALEWFEECSERGTGNFYDAAALALEDPAVDTLIVLTDGAPSGGRRWNMGLMVQLLLEADRYRPVALDALLVGRPPKLKSHWKALCEGTGGNVLEIEL